MVDTACSPSPEGRHDSRCGATGFSELVAQAAEGVPKGASAVLMRNQLRQGDAMRIENYHHIAAPIEAPDDSLVTAAEAEYIRNAIGEARLHLNDADISAGAENVWKAKQAIQSALDVLSDLVED